MLRVLASMFYWSAHSSYRERVWVRNISSYVWYIYGQCNKLFYCVCGKACAGWLAACVHDAHRRENRRNKIYVLTTSNQYSYAPGSHCARYYRGSIAILNINIRENEESCVLKFTTQQQSEHCVLARMKIAVCVCVPSAVYPVLVVSFCRWRWRSTHSLQSHTTTAIYPNSGGIREWPEAADNIARANRNIICSWEMLCFYCDFECTCISYYAVAHGSKKTTN